jgi:hypothetical protein
MQFSIGMYKMTEECLFFGLAAGSSDHCGQIFEKDYETGAGHKRVNVVDNKNLTTAYGGDKGE